MHFHDVPKAIPREILVGRDRIPPSQGVIPLRKVTAALSRIGYTGNLSTELFGAQYQNGNPQTVAQLYYKALQPFCGREKP
ncbi:MAG: sugar phosphate isomerase/epimerase [Acidobacteria bacterium]|nr:MAG: sugar phosphate isomerase/epimerase [Acidobacteriota bacterium]